MLYSALKMPEGSIRLSRETSSVSRKAWNGIVKAVESPAIETPLKEIDSMHACESESVSCELWSAASAEVDFDVRGRKRGSDRK